MSIYSKYHSPREYRVVWQSVNGPIPRDSMGRSYEIHHIDGDKTNNSIQNLQCVSIQEHFDIHYAQGDFHACWMIAHRMHMTPDDISAFNRDLIRALELPGRNKGKQAWNNGVRVTYSLECPGSGWVKGNLQNGRVGATANKVVWNDGTKIMYADICPGEGWNLGALPRPSAGPKKGSTRWTNGTDNKVSVNCPGNDWYPGWTNKYDDKPHPTEGKRMFNNGKKQQMFSVPPGPEWVEGSLKKGQMTSNIKNKKAYNNGICVKFFLTPPSDPQWVPGSLPGGSYKKKTK